MANKPAPRNWNDIQVAIATISMALTLAFWNMFAGPDRESAVRRAQEQAAIQPQPAVAQVVAAPQAPAQSGKILFGGSAPQTQVTVRGGGNGGGGGVTSTSSS